MMIAIGELKELRATALGYELVLKHLPYGAFFIEEKAGARAKRTFEPELQALSAGQVKLIAACLFHAKREHVYQIESLTLMMTSSEWIPLDHGYEKDLVDKLVAEQRAFLKPLRYDAKHAGKFPNFLLLDAGEQPIALDILSAFLTDPERAAKASAITARSPKGWAWDTAQAVFIPDLPPQSGAARQAKDREWRRARQQATWAVRRRVDSVVAFGTLSVPKTQAYLGRDTSCRQWRGNALQLTRAAATRAAALPRW